jgi:nitroreductase
MDAYLAIVSRREVRDYAQRPIPDDVACRILEAGRLAGSSANKQQRRFVIVEGKLRDRLAEMVYTASNVRGAAFVVAITATGRGPAGFDAGRAAQNMMLAAWKDGVGSCPNGMPDPEGAGALLGLEDDERPVIVLTFGYPARARDPGSRSPEEWVQRANRKAFDEVVVRAGGLRRT